MSEVKTEQTGVLAEYSEIAASLVTLKGEYEGKVYDVTTTAGMKEAKVDRALFRTGRADVEAVRKGLKKPYLERGRKIDSDAREIIEAFAELEKPVAGLIKEETDRKAAAKAEKERIELARVQDIQNRINGLRFNLSEYHPSEDIKAFADGNNAVVINEDGFGEFAEMAQTVKDDALKKAQTAFSKAMNREDEAKIQAEEKERLEAEKAELKEQREVQAAKQKELDEAEAAALTKDVEQDKPNHGILNDKVVVKIENESLSSASVAFKRIVDLCETPGAAYDDIIKDVYEVCATYIGEN